MTIEEQKLISGWVSVDDELPPVEIDVLVYDGFSVYISNRLDADGVVWDESVFVLDDVTHWMFIPKIDFD
jgi:hypothetical protein